MNPITNHPNATTAGGTGSLSVLLVYLLSVFGVHIDPALAAAIPTILTTAVLWIGKKGIKGTFRAIWDGPGK